VVFKAEMADSNRMISPLTLAGDDSRFAPFGNCFSLVPTAGRINVPLQFEGELAKGSSTLAIIVAPCIRSMGVINRIERHPFSVQAFLPLGAQPMVTFVARPGEPPRHAEEITAFVVPAGHGIAYRAGTWHSGLMGLDADVNVATFIRRIGDGSDTEFADLSFDLKLPERI
jgi:ureidoglycolate hydrolase